MTDSRFELARDSHQAFICHCSSGDMPSHARDTGLRRLSRLTVFLTLAAGALTAVFTGLAARAFPGRHASAGVPQASPVRAQNTKPAAPQLVPVQSGSSAAPASPSSPPVPSSSPPVATSGGS